MSKSRRKIPKETTPFPFLRIPKNIAYRMQLSECLTFDEYDPSASIHDSNPFGAYVNDHDKRVIFRQALRISPQYVACHDIDEMDSLIAKVFLAASKHQRRHLVVMEKHVQSVLERVDGENVKLFSGSNHYRISSTVTRALPANVVLCVDALPGDLGRLCYYDGTYAVSLIQPERICSLEIVTAPVFMSDPENQYI